MNSWTFVGLIDGNEFCSSDGFDRCTWYLTEGDSEDHAYFKVWCSTKEAEQMMTDCYIHQDDFEGILFKFTGHFGTCNESDLMVDSIEEL